MRAPPLLALLACSCLPPELPEWVVDYPITWGISLAVVENGPYSAAEPGIDAPDRTRAEAFPGDTVELRWYGIGPPDATIAPPIWFARPEDWRYDLADLLRGDVSPCPSPLPQGHPVCRLGTGVTTRARLDDTYDPAQPNYHFVAIASDAAVLDPETCVARTISADAGTDLLGCLISTRTLVLGPLPRLWFHLPYELRPQLLQKLSVDALGQLYQAPPNTNPVIEAIELATNDLHDGDHATVPAGAEVHLHLRLAPDAAQPFATTKGYRDEYHVISETEALVVAARFDAVVTDYTASADGLDHRFVIPDRGATVGLYLQLDDGRGGRAFATLDFTASDEAP